MNKLTLPEECSKQWEILLLLLSSEEKKIDRTGHNEVEVMLYFYRNEGIRKIFSEWLMQMNKSYAKSKSDLSTATKSNELSHKWRQKGNDCFRSNMIKESYKCYTKSVLYAAKEGTAYCLALANRSASLLRLKKFKQCLSDIELAIKHNYPLELRHKLYLRQTDCYIELQQAQLARKHLEVAQQHAMRLNLLPVHTADFDRHLKVLERKLEMLGDVNEYKPHIQLPELLNGESDSFASASSTLELRRDESSGRFVVAKDGAHRGDVLFKEEPYAFVTIPVEDDLAAVCEGCCEGDVNAVPCEVCSCAVYCSESCRDKAWESYHQWECQGAQSRLYNTIGIAHLALRVVLVSASRGFPTPPNTSQVKGLALDLFRAYSDCDNIDIYDKGTDPFYRMYNLVTNFDKMNNVDYVQYALTATMLTLYLELFTSFFEYLPSRLPCRIQDSEQHIFVAALILRSMGQLVCNGHATLRLSVSDDDVLNSKTQSEVEVRHATAIYPSAAMMNHSCDPNIINTFYRCQLIVRSASEVPPGGEVMNCYGPHRSTETTAERRAQLRAQYMFVCQCTACVDTDRKDFFSLFSAYSCQSCKGPVMWIGKRISCAQCHQDLNVERAVQTIGYADEMWDQAECLENWSLRCERAHAAFKLKQQVLHRHHSELRKMADQLARIYVETGDYTKSIELIKHNIQSLEYQYGSFSVEVANDLRKLAAVMLERIINLPQHLDYRDWCLETYKILKKAVQLMELNYGSWEPLVMKLKEQEAGVAALVASHRTSEEVNCVHKELHYNLKI